MILGGALFIILGMALMKGSQISTSWQHTNGSVQSVSEIKGNSGIIYTPVITYTAHGKDYLVTGQGSSSPAKVGSPVPVAYDPVSPASSKTVSSGGSKAVLAGLVVLGVVIVLLAIVLFIKSRKRGEAITNLMQTGTKIRGVVTAVNDQTPSAVNTQNSTNNSSYRVQVQAAIPDGTVKTFISDSVVGLGGIAMMDFRSNPVPVDVYLDPANPDNYYVDVSELPSLTPERISSLIGSAVEHVTNPNSFVPEPHITTSEVAPVPSFTPQGYQPTATITPTAAAPSYSQPQATTVNPVVTPEQMQPQTPTTNIPRQP